MKIQLQRMPMLKERYQILENQIDQIISRLAEFEKKFSDELSKVNPIYSKSARNLIHYLAFRSFDISTLQDELRDLSLPSLSNIESHVMKSILSIKNIISHLNGKSGVATRKDVVSIKKSKKILNRNSKFLFGYKSKKRRTRIMVTLPSTAAGEYGFVYHLMKLGMNCARINCAHDGPDVWQKMIANIKKANKNLNRNCKIMMDLGGPKIRTGRMIPGAEVIHIKPQRDEYGQVIAPAQVWIAPPDILPIDGTADAVLPVDEIWFKKIKNGNTISFTDTRLKKGKLFIGKKRSGGRWGLCSDSVYLRTDTELTLHKIKKGEEKLRVGRLLPLENSISLRTGDKLLLTKDPAPGEPAKCDESGKTLTKAHISCTLPEIFTDVKEGEPIFFDDGKIEGFIEKVSTDYLEICISDAKELGSKLKAGKGINFPSSDLKISGLTEKDKEDLKFIKRFADAVNFSFVNDENDVEQLHREIGERNPHLGVILKIETQKGFKNLPRILLRAMRMYPVGVMVARGDLAIETGWKNFASIQEEILRICEAAHIPDVWATQVLESLAKKGVPTRAEITDAALAQRAECVMLNKGPFITKAVKMLDKILRRMQHFQKKKETVLPRLEGAEELRLSHDLYNI